MTKKIILPAVFIIAAAAYGFYHFIIHGGEISTDDAYVQAHVIPLIPKVPGYIQDVHMEDNQPVRKGDVLVEIVPEDYAIRVSRAQAALAAIEARIGGSTANLATAETNASTLLSTAEAAVRAAESNVTRAQNELKRLKGIGPDFVSKKQMDDAVADERDARAKLQEARAQLQNAGSAPNSVRIAKSGVGEQQSLLDQAKADLAAAESDLRNTKIIASDDGVISKRTAETGAYIAPGQMIGALVTNERWIVANFKETQLKNIRPGQRVKIDVDAYPNLDLTGKVDSIQQGTGAVFSAFPPENATGNFVKIVQRVPVKIVLDGALPPGVVLGPGMSVVPTVYTR